MQISDIVLTDNDCVKINTGAAVPAHADAIIQIEDTKLLSSDDGVEETVEILTQPVKDIDIRHVTMKILEENPLIAISLFCRQIGSDLTIGSRVFQSEAYPGHVPYRSLLASVGIDAKVREK